MLFMAFDLKMEPSQAKNFLSELGVVSGSGVSVFTMIEVDASFWSATVITGTIAFVTGSLSLRLRMVSASSILVLSVVLNSISGLS